MSPTFSTLALGFLTPWLMAAGAAATSIPIIIHLLNKRKFRIVVWAAMEWLLAAQRRNARRLRFQRWLLLALRCLAILIIAAGIAQMILQSSAVATILGEQRAVVILWDDSYSMGYQQDAVGGGANSRTAFEQSKRTISDFIGQLRSGDKVMVIHTSTGAPDSPEAVTGKPTPDHQSVISQVNRARITEAATDLPGAFDRATQVLSDLGSSTRTRQLLLITDFSTSSIRDPQQTGTSQDTRIQGVDGLRLKKSAEAAIAKATDFRMVPVGSPDQSNLAVTSLTTRRPAIVAGVPAEVLIQVFNGTDRVQPDVPVTLVVDGIPGQTVKIPRVEPGSANNQPAVVPITLPTPGRHLIEARLPGDLLPVDDLRRLMVNVRKEIPVLLVDGAPNEGGNSAKRGATYLFAAYAGDAENPIGAFAPKVITELELGTTPLDNFDVVVLSDTAAPPPGIRDNLKNFVDRGGLLLLFLGNHTNATSMNDSLGTNGANLLPATLGQIEKPVTPAEVEKGIRLAPENYKHPVLGAWANDVTAGRNVGLDLHPFKQYMKLGIPVDGSVDVILRFAKSDGTPGDAAVVAKDVGKGKVVLFSTTAYAGENGWGDFSAKGNFVVLVQETTYYALPRNSAVAGAGLTLTVGSPMRLPAEIASPGLWAGPRDIRVAVTREMGADQRAVLSSSPLTDSGLYMPTAGDGRAVVAVNPDMREADIRPIQFPQMAAALGVDANVVVTAPQLAALVEARADSQTSWLGPFLVAVALGIFLLESICALAFSTYR